MAREPPSALKAMTLAVNAPAPSRRPIRFAAGLRVDMFIFSSLDVQLKFAPAKRQSMRYGHESITDLAISSIIEPSHRCVAPQ
jgi:hypothetical protein